MRLSGRLSSNTCFIHISLGVWALRSSSLFLCGPSTWDFRNDGSFILYGGVGFQPGTAESWQDTSDARIKTVTEVTNYDGLDLADFSQSLRTPFAISTRF